MVEWQYRIHEGPLCEAELNHFGSDGWELVCVQREAELTYYFKRRLSEAQTPRNAPDTSVESKLDE